MKSDAAMLYYRCDEDVCRAVATAFTFMCEDKFEDSWLNGGVRCILSKGVTSLLDVSDIRPSGLIIFINQALYPQSMIWIIFLSWLVTGSPVRKSLPLEGEGHRMLGRPFSSRLRGDLFCAF